MKKRLLALLLVAVAAMPLDVSAVKDGEKSVEAGDSYFDSLKKPSMLWVDLGILGVSAVNGLLLFRSKKTRELLKELATLSPKKAWAAIKKIWKEDKILAAQLACGMVAGTYGLGRGFYVLNSKYQEYKKTKKEIVSLRDEVKVLKTKNVDTAKLRFRLNALENTDFRQKEQQRIYDERMACMNSILAEGGYGQEEYGEEEDEQGEEDSKSIVEKETKTGFAPPLSLSAEDASE